MALTTSTKHACPSRSPGQTWESFFLVVAKKDSKVRRRSRNPLARLWFGRKCHKGHRVLAQMLLLGHLSKLSNTGTRLKFFALNHNANVQQKNFHPQSRVRIPHSTRETFLPNREGSSFLGSRLLQLYLLYGTAFVTVASFLQGSGVVERGSNSLAHNL